MICHDMAAYLWVQGQNLSAAEEDGYGEKLKLVSQSCDLDQYKISVG